MSNAMALVNYLTARHYPVSEVLDSLIKVNAIERDKALNGNPTQNAPEIEKQKFYLITTYNPSNPDIKSIVKKHWQQFGRVKSTRKLLDAEIIFGHRNCPNIQDKIVRAKIPTNGQTKKKKQKACNRKGTCRYCPKMSHSGTITNIQNGRKYRTMVKTNCQSSNLVFLAIYVACNM